MSQAHLCPAINTQGTITWSQSTHKQFGGSHERILPSTCCALCRVIRRMAVPSAISAALPKDTIHYGCKILRATVTPTGEASQWRSDVAQYYGSWSLLNVAACLCCGGSCWRSAAGLSIAGRGLCGGYMGLYTTLQWQRQRSKVANLLFLRCGPIRPSDCIGEGSDDGVGSKRLLTYSTP